MITLNETVIQNTRRLNQVALYIKIKFVTHRTQYACTEKTNALMLYSASIDVYNCLRLQLYVTQNALGGQNEEFLELNQATLE